MTESTHDELTAIRAMDHAAIGFMDGTSFAVTGPNAGHWVEGAPTHEPVGGSPALTRDDYTLIENWYDWYLNSPGGKWANEADVQLLKKLKVMIND